MTSRAASPDRKAGLRARLLGRRRAAAPPISSEEGTRRRVEHAEGKYFSVKVATYNIHRCQGLDGRTRSDRVASVIADTGADVVALQEVLGEGAGGQAALLAQQLGMTWVMARNRNRRGHPLGNAVLSRHPILHHESTDLSLYWYSRRNCQRVDLDLGGHVLHLFNVHLGYGHVERQRQALMLETFINDDVTRNPRVVLGDFNEWAPSEVTRMLERSLRAIDLVPYLERRRTYPGVLPLVHLDHIFYAGDVELTAVDVPRTLRALVASDHLPLVATLRIRDPKPALARSIPSGDAAAAAS